MTYFYKIEEIKENLSRDCLDFLDLDYLESEEYPGFIDEDDLELYINESIEFIYTSDAMGYLSNNDVDLRTSTSLAAEMGISTEQLDSCLLATLLIQDAIRKELPGTYEESEIEKDLEDE